MEVENVEEAVSTHSANTIVVFVFEERIREWMLGKITQLSNKFTAYDIVFLYNVI